MARGKKAEKVLTIEEKLERALVPVGEQPYSIPGNWCWIHLKIKLTVKKVASKTYLEKGKLAIVDQGKGLVGRYTDDENMAFSGKLPVIIFGDHTRCIKYVDFPFAQGADGIKVLLPKSFYLPKAFYHALQSIDIPDMGYRRHYPLFSHFCIPVPPLAEQQRIVDRIESLFAKLDEAEEKAQAVVDGFELRKSAILHKAFIGELTEQWRNAYGVTRDSWELQLYRDLGSFKLGKMLDKAKNTGMPTPYLRNVNVRWFEFDLSNVACMLASEEERELLSVKKGDLFICEGGEPGRCAIWKDDDSKLIFQKALHRFRPNEKVISDFLCYNLYYMSLSDLLAKHFTGTTIKHLTGKSLSDIRVMLPSIEEQEEVVKILDKLFAKEQQAKAAAESVLDQIDTMKKAILARAFCGGLGTNDPTEESAVELLKTVL